METRKEQLLGLVVEEYIKTAQPIGSKFLSTETELRVSAATIRNEMRDLEETGMLAQPHTSAGRIPTEAGYRYYVDNILKIGKLTKKKQENLQKIEKLELDKKSKYKEMAKYISEDLGAAVIIAFGSNSLYYTGIGNLFSQPEFQTHAHTVDVSAVFDKCEEVIDQVFEEIEKGLPKVLVGKENPFGSVCSLVGVRFGNHSLLSVLGPMRMNYGRSLEFLDFIKEID